MAKKVPSEFLSGSCHLALAKYLSDQSGVSHAILPSDDLPYDVLLWEIFSWSTYLFLFLFLSLPL